MLQKRKQRRYEESVPFIFSLLTKASSILWVQICQIAVDEATLYDLEDFNWLSESQSGWQHISPIVENRFLSSGVKIHRGET